MKKEPKRFLNSEQKQKTLDLMTAISADISQGKTVRQIREQYMNEKTGEPYAREYIYYLIRKMKKQKLLAS